MSTVAIKNSLTYLFMISPIPFFEHVLAHCPQKGIGDLSKNLPNQITDRFMGTEIIFLIVILGLLFDYTNGFHDAANVVATPIATKIVTPLVAIIMATVFNFLGATQISGVAETITTGL